MADYRVVFTRSARKELENLPPPTGARVISIAKRLAADPRPVGAGAAGIHLFSAQEDAVRTFSAPGVTKRERRDCEDNVPFVSAGAPA